MGGKGGGPSVDQNAINQQFYQAGAQGQKWNDIQGYMPSGGNYDMGLQSWLAGGASRQQAHEPAFHFPEFGGAHASASASGPTYEQQLADQQAMQAQAAADAARAAGLAERDQLFGSYMDAAGSATDYINSEIQREQANARLLGIDYSIDDTQKTTRINNYFASIWGEGEQGRLDALMGEWGKPEGFQGYTVTRGDGSKYAGAEGEETTVGTSKGQRPATIVTEEEEPMLGGVSVGNVLGV